MKHILTLILTLILAGCGTTTGLVADIGVTFGIGKMLENSSERARPGRVTMLREAAAGLRKLAQGTVSRGEVEQLLSRFLHEGAEMVAVRAAVLAYFPPETDVPIHHNEALAAVARRVAGLIESALPPAASK